MSTSPMAVAGGAATTDGGPRSAQPRGRVRVRVMSHSRAAAAAAASGGGTGAGRGLSALSGSMGPPPASASTFTVPPPSSDGAQKRRSHPSPAHSSPSTVLMHKSSPNMGPLKKANTQVTPGSMKSTGVGVSSLTSGAATGNQGGVRLRSEWQNGFIRALEQPATGNGGAPAGNSAPGSTLHRSPVRSDNGKPPTSAPPATASGGGGSGGGRAVPGVSPPGRRQPTPASNNAADVDMGGRRNTAPSPISFANANAAGAAGAGAAPAGTSPPARGTKVSPTRLAPLPGASRAQFTVAAPVSGVAVAATYRTVVPDSKPVYTTAGHTASSTSSLAGANGSAMRQPQQQQPQQPQQPQQAGSMSHLPPQAPLSTAAAQQRAIAMAVARKQQETGMVIDKTWKPITKASPGKWSKEEDELLREAVGRFSAKGWKKIAKALGHNRTDVQCLHRWNKVLKVSDCVCVCPVHVAVSCACRSLTPPCRSRDW